MHEILTLLLGLTGQLVCFVALGYVSHTLSARWFSEGPAGERWCATGILFSWFLSVIFAVLISVRMFAPLPAILVALAGVAVARGVLGKPARCAHFLAGDFAFAGDSTAGLGDKVAWWTTLTCLVLLSALLAIRTLALPLLGWDWLTYHGLKAGLWVQSGAWPTLDAPGAWEYYRSFFGGAEVFNAWAMLFVHCDLFAGLPDLGFWLLFGLTTACIARRLGVRPRTSVLVAAAFLCAPSFSRMVGSGYVDTCANAFLLGGLLFLLRFTRSRQPADLCLAAASFGLASSVKVNMLFVSIAMALAVIALLFIYRWRSAAALLLCALLYAAPVVPWLLFNYLSTGYPLGSVPLSVGPIHLGAAPPNFAWFLDRPDLAPYEVFSELRELYHALQRFGLSLLLSCMGIAGLLLGVWRRRCEHILIFLLMASVTALYFSPSFSVVRLGWAWENGRFLAPAVILSAAGGLSVLHGLRHGTALIESVATLSAIAGVWQYVQWYVLGSDRAEMLFLGLAVSLVVLFYCLTWWRGPVRWLRARVAVPLFAIMFLGTMVGCVQLKNWFRIRAYSECTIMHDFPRYWVPALHALDSESPPLRIAFAYGPLKVSHRAHLAPFLGADLNNRLMYVSPEKDGSVVPHHPAYLAGSRPDFAHWMTALHRAQATHVLLFRPNGSMAPHIGQRAGATDDLLFRPPCQELQWVEDHPTLFTRLAGETHDWGLFRIEWATTRLGGAH